VLVALLMAVKIILSLQQMRHRALNRPLKAFFSTAIALIIAVNMFDFQDKLLKKVFAE